MEKQEFIANWPVFCKKVPFLSGADELYQPHTRGMAIDFRELDGALRTFQKDNNNISCYLNSQYQVIRELRSSRDLLREIIKEGLRR